MTVFTEGRHPGEGIMSEANGQRSRDNITIAAGSGVIAPMTVLGLFTSGANVGKYGPAPDVAGSPDVGNQVARAICIYGGDATSADLKVAALARDAEVRGSALTFHASVNTDAERATKRSQLAAVGIIVR